MKLIVVDIPEDIGGKQVDETALLVYLEDVKTMLDSAAVSGNDHPIVQKTHQMTDKYKNLLARYDKHLDEELAFQKEMANTASEMMDKFALKAHEL